MHTPRETDSERLERLERELTLLRTEVAGLRRQAGLPVTQRVRLDEAQSAAAESPPRRLFPEPGADRAESGDDDLTQGVEEIVGRYGMLALGALTVLVAMGTFLSWTIRRGLLGPTTRVGLGALAAIALAFAGLRLRQRSMREFGNVILALAMATAHLVCWSVGPLLHLVPTFVALLAAFFTAAVLAEFALRNDEHLLFCVGFGGALLAPFVTTYGADSLIALAIYGVGVIGLAAAALGDRRWMLARRIVMASFLFYLMRLFVGSSHPHPDDGFYGSAERLSAIAFALLLSSGFAIGVHPQYRRTMLRLGALGIATAGLAWSGQANEWLIALSLTVAGAVIVMTLLYVTTPASPVETAADEKQVDGLLRDIREVGTLASSTAMDGALVPIALFAATISLVPSRASWTGVVCAVGWTLALAALCFRARAERIGRWYPFATSFAAIGAAYLMPFAVLGRAASLTAVAALLALMHARLPRYGFVTGTGLALFMASIGPIDSVSRRVPFSYDPFLEMSSFAAIIAILGWLVMPLLLERDNPEMDRVRSVTRWIAGGACILWLQGELQGAYSPTFAFALLVSLYTITGFAAIEWGRRTNARALRIVGLALTVLAAGKALFEVLELRNVGLRVGSLLLVSVFMIVVAYRYRQKRLLGGEPVL